VNSTCSTRRVSVRGGGYSLSIMSMSPSPGASNNGSAGVFKWQCQKEVVNACGVDVDGEDDDEGAG
jgi:hypothetical protein